MPPRSLSLTQFKQRTPSRRPGKMIIEHLLRTGITAEVLPGPIRINLDSCLTEDTVQDLLPTLKRGVAFQGCPDLVVDPAQVDHIDAAALDIVEVFTSGHNATGEAPVISVELPRPGLSSDGGPARCGAVVPSQSLSNRRERASSDGQVSSDGRSSMLGAPSVVADLMVPIGAGVIGITHSLREAAERLGDEVVAQATATLGGHVPGEVLGRAGRRPVDERAHHRGPLAFSGATTTPAWRVR